MNEEKVHCKVCDALILVRTAKANDGMCRPCANLAGERASREGEPIGKTVAAMFTATPPRCLGAFTARPIDRLPGKTGSMLNREWDVLAKLGCPCGTEFFDVVGHYQPHPDNGKLLFLGPLQVTCRGCHRHEVVFDIEQHGYDAVVCKDYRSIIPTTAAEPFRCATCGPAPMEVYVWFEYADDMFDGDLDEYADRFQDIFTWFVTHGRCTKCSRVCDIVSYECA